MIDLNIEKLITLVEAAKYLPHRPHISTLHRWRTKGVQGVRLETVLIGGRRLTSTEALQRFMEARSEEEKQEPSPAENRAQSAEAELDKLWASSKRR